MKNLKQMLTLISASAVMISSAFATPVTRNDVVGVDTTMATANTNVVTTVGCASSFSCTLEEFANGAMMTVNGITMSNVSIDFSAGAYSSILPGELEIYGLDNVINPYTGGFGLRGAADFPFDLFGFDSGDMDIVFDLSVMTGMQMVGMGAVSQVFAGMDFGSFLSFEGDNGMYIDLYNDDFDSSGIETAAFADVSNLHITAAMSNWANANGYLFYDGFQFAIETVSVPEPAPILLMLIGLGWLVRKRR